MIIILKGINLEEIYNRFTNLYKNRPYLSLWRSCEAVSVLTSLNKIEKLSALNAKSDFSLDIGCGDGRTARGLGLNFTVGLDPDLASVREAKNCGQYESVIIGDATTLPLKRASFYFVLSNCVFEHIENIEGAVVNVSNSLCEDGVLIITMPTKNLISDISFLMPFSLAGLYNIVKRYVNKSLKHYHYFEDSILRMFNKAGLRLVSVSYYMPSILISWWLFLRYSERIFYRLHITPFWRAISGIIEKINYSLVKKSLEYKKSGGGITIVLVKDGG